ncbi:MAG: 5'-nucleotidase, partial [Bdellovibrionales bacterium]|nr:5'-nucleotidase [Bdellovibrionales bacterium]
HRHWSELFEFVIAGAQKPRFFFERNPFLRVNAADGTLTPWEGKLAPGVYTGGSAVKFTDDLGVEGDDILYIGDHIYGDVVRLKKDCNWRTALVVEDLEHEIPKYEVVRPIQGEIDRLMAKKEPLEDLHVDLHSRKIECGAEPPTEEVQRLLQEMAEIDRQVAEKIRHYQAAFNPRWGEVMRAGNEESHFAHQVDRFACIYTARLGDLLKSSPRTYFRAARRPLAHELALQMRAEVSPFE